MIKVALFFRFGHQGRVYLVTRTLNWQFWDETWQEWSMAIAGGTTRPVLNLATRGPSLFSNPNPKLAVLAV